MSTTTDQTRARELEQRAARSGWSARLVEHRPFLVALALGAALRVLVHVAFRPALMVSDGPTYLSFLDDLEPNVDRPDGYGLLVLLPLSWLTEDVLAVAVAQHVLGLGTAVLLYAVLRRWGVGRWPATLACLPVLLDAMQLLLEHAPLSDTTFVLLVTAGVVVLAWRRRPTLPLALLAGLLLGASTTVRQVGMPLVVAGVVFCLLVGRTWRARVGTALVLVAGFAVPVGGYMSWYASEHGVYALSEIGGRSAYMRTTTFVQCDGLDIADYQRVLCPPEPVGERQDPTNYGWYDAGDVGLLAPPPGVGEDDAQREFASAAMAAQPFDYAAVVARDLALNFDLWRGNRFELDTSFKWRFDTYVDAEPTSWTGPAFAEHGGDQLTTRHPWADALVVYQYFGYLPGPLLLACLLMGVAGSIGLGRARRSGLRAVTFLMTSTGLGLMLVPAITTQFVWRYQLPALVLLPAAAALAWTALRSRRDVGRVGYPSDEPAPRHTPGPEGRTVPPR